uniref:Reverse transcriptase domain-containing protein n=1 Tax=Tanacetum cinerariifolium TaxID=118510 RepID=A0A6L2JSC3_TANCI|nr:reverse transcriptase domain-containing protein [Tanacetum cinerariifolium]
MSAMANTTPLVTTVNKPVTNPRDANATPRVNIQEFCEEYYEDILPIIMDKVRRDRRKDVHTRLDFREDPRERTREDSHHSSVRARTTKPERLRVQDRLRYGDRHVLDRLDSRDHPRGRSRPHRLDTSNEDCPKDRERFRSVRESYDDSFSHSHRDGNRSRHMKRRRDNESLLSSVSKSYSSDGRGPCQSFPGGNTCGTVGNAYMVSYVQLNPNRGGQETRRMKGAPECMRISEFMHGVNNPELTKRLNEHVPKKMKEMMIATTAFIRGEAAAASKKKGHTSWKIQGQSKRQTSDKRFDFRGHSREGRGSNWFTHLTRTPKEILAAEAGKFPPPPPMVTPVEKRSSNKFCDFHNDKGHITDECMQLKKQIEELETPAKDKPTAIYMIQSWQRMTRQKVTQSFERVKEITFPPLTASNGTKGPLVIEAEMGGHMIHRMFVDGGSLMEILYEHCFNRLRPEIKSQMVPATTSLTGFSGETIWPLGQLRLLVIIRDANHSTRAWMNFMNVRSLSPYNGIIGRPGIREIQSVPSTAHIMLKFPVEGGIVTICSTILIPTECTSLITSSAVSKKERTHLDNFKVALHLDFPDQEVAIGGTLSEKGRTEMCSILKKNLDIFAWKSSDMTGIQLAELDEEKTTFHTGQGVHCYTKMPFGLKNAGATYQRLMDKAFNGQIGRNIEVYVDDLVVKSYTEAKMLRDIDETFRTLQKNNMKLNPKKYTFGVAEGVFLGYVVTPDGIKPCLDKTTAVLQLPSPRTIKEVQSHNGKLAKAEQAFKQLKQHLSELPQLVAPNPKEELIIYLSATYGAISAVLVEVLKDKSIKEKEVTTVVEEDGPTWMTPIVEYLKEGTLPSDKKEGRKLRIKARQYKLMEGILYRRSFLTLWLRCVGQLQVEYMIREIHEGSCKVKFLIVDMDYFTKWIEAKAVPQSLAVSGHTDRDWNATYRTAAVDVVSNDEELRLNLDLLEERRKRAAICEAKAKLKMTKYYNAWVRGVTFRPGDFVYRSNDASHAVAGRKLGPK